MATEVVKIVDPDNGPGTDYTSLAAWEAGEQRDLVAADEIAVAKCRCTNGSADATTVTIEGWTTNSDCYIKVWTDPDEGYRHDGKWNDSSYRLDPGTNNGLYVRQGWVYIIGLQIHATHKVQSGHVYARYPLLLEWCTSGDVVIDKSIIRLTAKSTKGYGINIYDPNDTTTAFKIRNCVIYQDGSSTGEAGIRIGAASNDTVEIFNCTVYNFGIGIFNQSGSPDVIVQNCAVFGNSDDFSNVSTIDHCASDDGDGTNAVVPSDWSLVFVDYPNGDFHLKSTDTDLRDAGVDLSSEGFTDDIDGETRSAPWDIGADEYVSGGEVLTAVADILSTSLTSTTLFSVFRYSSASFSSLSTTSSKVSSNVLRELSTLIEVKTSSSDSAELSIVALVEAVANIASQVLTSNAKLLVLRPISTEVQVRTASHVVVLELIRSITSAIQVTVSTSDSAELVIVKIGQVEIVTTAQVAQAALAILKTLAVDITSDVVAADMLLTVLRSVSAGIDSTTLTGVVELITTMGLIVDTSIESLTPKRVIEEV